MYVRNVEAFTSHWESTLTYAEEVKRRALAQLAIAGIQGQLQLFEEGKYTLDVQPTAE